MRTTKSRLWQYHLALLIVQHDKPLLSLDDKLNLYPEINEAEKLLDGLLKSVSGKRGNVRVDVDLPATLQTPALNKALRYGLQYAVNSNSKQEPSFLDRALAIALADRMIPPKAETKTVSP